MKKVFLVVCIVVGVYQLHGFWVEHRAQRAYLAFEASLPKDRPDSRAGFVNAVQPEGTNPNIVTVLMPVGCPMEAGRRGRALIERLKGANIPVTASANARVMINAKSKAEFDVKLGQVNTVMGGETPIVFYRGRAKNNPSFEDVLLEYQTAR